ncbi:hypothetical protein OEZ60_20120 [Defluviimonas sp. WL0024]|uniref:Uncharacterized protein n=1 Tax=Albidovulum salinarum TaxID=2984153 RepID=A0ABT2XB76_9RHOB|nr:hypothetical protein [Defluviimonas sp. WL0024]MCU9850297.1 hypothetical protein [Defluviimonas sp. WL0024]
MADIVWLSVAPQKSELSARFDMEDRVVPPLERSKNAMFHRGGGHLDPDLLPQRAVEQLPKATRISHLFMVNGFLCMTEKAATVLRQHDLGGGGLYPLELFRHDGVTPVPGPFWALNFGQKKSAVNAAESTGIDGPYPDGKCHPKFWIKDDELAVGAAALEGADIWGDSRSEIGFFVSPKLGAALHKAGLAKVFHLVRCRIV